MTDIPRVATIVILLIVVIVGGVVVIINPATLDFTSYIRDVAIAAGLLGIGLGIDPSSRP